MDKHGWEGAQRWRVTQPSSHQESATDKRKNKLWPLCLSIMMFPPGIFYWTLSGSRLLGIKKSRTRFQAHVVKNKSCNTFKQRLETLRRCPRDFMPVHKMRPAFDCCVCLCSIHPFVMASETAQDLISTLSLYHSSVYFFASPFKQRDQISHLKS